MFAAKLILSRLHLTDYTWIETVSSLTLSRRRINYNLVMSLADYCIQDDVCESLKIPYGHIRSVTIDTTIALPPQNATVHANLAASPIMGEASLDIMAGQSLYVKFEVQREDLSRLMEALRRRGIVSARRSSMNKLISVIHS